jgi:hypothetical protein
MFYLHTYLYTYTYLYKYQHIFINLGPFTAEFRANLVKLWQESLVLYEIPHTAGCNLEVTLADPVRVR